MTDWVLGVDVSHWQSDIDWAKLVEKDVKYVFVKATEGVGGMDVRFEKNWHAAGEAGLLRGAYHFFRPDYPAADQAKFFYDTLVANGGQGDLPPVLDVEKRPFYAKDIKDCLMELERLFGMQPIIYTAPGLWNEMGGVSWANDYPLWVAQYPFKGWADGMLDRVAQNQPRLPRDWSSWSIWQFTENGPGKSYGVGSHRLDMNYFNGDWNAFQAYLKHSKEIAEADLKSGKLPGLAPSGRGISGSLQRPVPGVLSIEDDDAEAPADEQYPDEVEPGVVIPELPKAVVVAPIANVRSNPMVATGNIRYKLEVGDEPAVIEILSEGADIWLKIGWEQWVAMRYDGVQYLEWA